MLVPMVPLRIQMNYSFHHCTVPGTSWKENSAIIPERVATVQLCGLRKKLLAFFSLLFCEMTCVLKCVVLKLMGRYTGVSQFKKT